MLISSWLRGLLGLSNSSIPAAHARRKRHQTLRESEALEMRLMLTTPTVASLSLVEPSTTNANTLSWTATFTDAVTGVDPTDFALTKTGTVGTTLMQVTGSGSTYTVTVSGVSGDGTLGLNLVDDDSIHDALNAPLGGAGAGNGDFTGQVYKVDHTFPSVLSINRTDPTSSPTSASTVTFTATFSESVSGVDLSDFILFKDPALSTTLTEVTQLSQSTYSITISGISGSGTLWPFLRDNNSIRDLAGNPLLNTTTYASFTSWNVYPSLNPAFPNSMLVTDVNGDGKADILATNTNPQSIGVFLGNGDGSFQDQQIALAQAQPRAIAAGDLNGDGKPDLAIISDNDDTVKIALGNGDGTFQNPTSYTVSSGPLSVLMCDFNGDGKLDLAVPTSANLVSILLGNGDGTFQTQHSFAAPIQASSFQIADLNSDGKPDLIVLGSTINVLLGNGDGTFQSVQTIDPGALNLDLYSVAVGDVNGDGAPDLVVGAVNHVTGAGAICILVAKGDGSYLSQPLVASKTAPMGQLTLGDINGDGILDIIDANETDNCASEFLGNGDGTFKAEQTIGFSAQRTPTVVSLQDLNADGRPDIAVLNAVSGTISVDLANSNGNFSGQTYNLVAQAPTVQSPASTNVSRTTATLGGNVTSDEGRTLTAVGILYAPTSNSPNLTLGGQGVINLTSTPGSGAFTIDVTGLLPATSYSFVAYATNEAGTTYTSPVSTFTTAAINRAPSGASGTVTTPQETPYVLKTSDFGFTDPGNTPANSLLAVKFTLLSAYGTLTNDGVAVAVNQYVSAADISAGKLVFTPSVSVPVIKLFLAKFQVQDDGGTGDGGSDLDPVAQVLTFQLIKHNHAPVGTSATISTPYDGPYTLKASDFGFSDPDDNQLNSLLAVKFTLLSAYGTLTDNGVTVTANQFVSAIDINRGQLVFTPTVSALGTTLFLAKFQVQDNGGTAFGGHDLDPVAKVLYATMVVANHAPVGAAATVATGITSNYTLKTSDFGFSDPNDHPANSLIAVKFTLLSAYGTLTNNGFPVVPDQFVSVADIANGKLVFTPYVGASGSKLFLAKFQVQDNGGTADGGQDLDPVAKILYFGVKENHAPVGTTNVVTGSQNMSYTVRASDFGFSDPNDNPPNALAAVKVTLVTAYGTLTDNGVAVSANQFVSVADINAGKLVFTPQAGLVGGPYFMFNFQVQDDGGHLIGFDTDPNVKTLYVKLTP